MRIALFSDSFLPVLNGVSIAVRSLARELRGMGHEVFVFAPHFHGYDDEEPNVIRFPAVHPPVAYRFPFAMPVGTAVGRRFNEIKPDLIHTHTPFMVGLLGRNWGKHENIPVVSTYHTLYEEYVHYVPMLPKWWLRSWLAAYLRFYYGGCDALITPSRTALASLRSYKIEKAVSIIPTGMPNARVLDRANERQALGFGPDEQVLLYVGRVAREKNIPLLLRSAKLIFERFSQARLVLVGAGPALGEGQKLAEELGISNRVEFAGARPREDVDRFYAAADLFVFPSETETQGLVIGEAQTFGLPCVAVEGGGAGEALRHEETGLIVPSFATDFAEAVSRLLSDDALRRQYSEAARTLWQDRTPRDTACRVLEVYQSVMKTEAP